MTKAHVIGSLAKNSAEDVVVSLDTYRGVWLVDIRVHADFVSNVGKMPTKKGVAIRTEKLPELIGLLQRAQATIEDGIERVESEGEPARVPWWQRED